MYSRRCVKHPNSYLPDQGQLPDKGQLPVRKIPVRKRDDMELTFLDTVRQGLKDGGPAYLLSTIFPLREVSDQDFKEKTTSGSSSLTRSMR